MSSQELPSDSSFELRQRLYDAIVLSPFHPHRPPDWRWRLSEKLINESPPEVLPTHEDEWVNQAIRLRLIIDIRFTDVGNYEQRLEQLQRLPRQLTEAYFLRFSTDPWDKGVITRSQLQQAYLEALILAGKKSEKIANVFGVSPQAIEAYENLWFDVRSRLKAKAWIATQVIGKLYDRNISQLLPALIRAFGYHTRKASIVHSVVSLCDAQLAKGALTKEMFFLKDKTFTLGVKAAISAKLFGLDPMMFDVVMKAHNDAINTLIQGGQLVQDEGEKEQEMIRVKILKKSTQQHRQLPPVELTADDIQKVETELLGEDFKPGLE